MTRTQALSWTGFWILLAVMFNGYIYHEYGAKAASEFGNAYIMEKLLSFDNLFVFMLIFNYFNINSKQQRRVLNYGVAGAVILRGVCIFAGVELLDSFQWLFYCLGAVLVYSAYGIFTSNDDEDDSIEKSRIIRWCKNANIGTFMAALIAVELSDVIFAMDSIPAVLAITNDPLIAYSSNIFAILGLRSLYFVMTSFEEYFKKMSYGIGAVLAFIGLKMLAMDFIHIPAEISLLITAAILGSNVLLIKLMDRKHG